MERTVVGTPRTLPLLRPGRFDRAIGAHARVCGAHSGVTSRRLYLPSSGPRWQQTVKHQRWQPPRGSRRYGTGFLWCCATQQALKEAQQGSESEAATADSVTQKEELVLLETNVDDMEPELLAYASEQLLERGALDVWRTPIVMKKGRAAVMLSCICRTPQQQELIQLILEETSSLGVRTFPFTRWTASRSFVSNQMPTFIVDRMRRSGLVCSLEPVFSYRKLSRLAGEALA